MKASGRKRIPLSVARRFPKYYARVQRLRQDGVQWVSSSRLASDLSLTSSTVRQDLSHVDFSGISKRGYSTEGLENTLAKVMGVTEDLRFVIVGAGNLGQALARHTEFAAKGFRICGVFDCDPRVIGRKVGGTRVQSMEDLPATVEAKEVDIGIIAVPAAAAQQVADQLVRSNIRGLLNMAHIHLLVPKHVPVVDARIIACLQELSFAIRTQRAAHRA